LIRRIDLNDETPEAVAASLGITKNNLNVRIHRAAAKAAARRKLPDLRQAWLFGVPMRDAQRRVSFCGAV